MITLHARDSDLRFEVINTYRLGVSAFLGTVTPFKRGMYVRQFLCVVFYDASMADVVKIKR